MPTYKSYISGFILSIALTLAAYFAVVNQWHGALIIILVLAVVQLLVQLIFFLHIGTGADRRWNLAALISTVSVILILVIGSIWIMAHLNYNMTPMQMNDYMLQQENILK